MSELTFIVPVKGRLAHLQVTLPLMLADPRAECVVVDYSCPEHSGDWVRQNFPLVKVVSVPDQTFFNLSRARNLGVVQVCTPWLVFIDADVRLVQGFVGLLLPQLIPGHFYRSPETGAGCSGFVVCARQDFDQVGGYNEALIGWGFEDTDFERRLEQAGVVKTFFGSGWLSHIWHDDILRAQFYTEKDLGKSRQANKVLSEQWVKPGQKSGRHI